MHMLHAHRSCPLLASRQGEHYAPSYTCAAVITATHFQVLLCLNLISTILCTYTWFHMAQAILVVVKGAMCTANKCRLKLQKHPCPPRAQSVARPLLSRPRMPSVWEASPVSAGRSHATWASARVRARCVSLFILSEKPCKISGICCLNRTGVALLKAINRYRCARTPEGLTASMRPVWVRPDTAPDPGKPPYCRWFSNTRCIKCRVPVVAGGERN